MAYCRGLRVLLSGTDSTGWDLRSNWHDRFTRQKIGHAFVSLFWQQFVLRVPEDSFPLHFLILFIPMLRPITVVIEPEFRCSKSVGNKSVFGPCSCLRSIRPVTQFVVLEWRWSLADKRMKCGSHSATCNLRCIILWFIWLFFVYSDENQVAVCTDFSFFYIRKAFTCMISVRSDE